MSTQNLSDFCNSEIADVILENCPTKILLPNAEAANPNSRAFYDRLGLNDRELSAIQSSLPKRHYYVVSPLGRRMVTLGLGKVALSFVGVNGREERRRAEETMEQFGEVWPGEWLNIRGLADWAEYYCQLENGKEDYLCAEA